MKDVIKWGDQLNRLLEKTAANIFEYPGERKIFGKYLHREGLDWEIFCFVVFFSARPNCSIHKILDFPDQPFMFFANMCTNIWLILYKKNIWNKALVVVDKPDVEFLDLDQNWAKTRSLLLKTFISLIFIVQRIVHCPCQSWPPCPPCLCLPCPPRLPCPPYPPCLVSTWSTLSTWSTSSTMCQK